MQRRQLYALLVVLVVMAGLSLLLGPRGGEETLRAAEQASPSASPSEDPVTAPGVPERVTEFLRNGQSWRAARAMRQHLAGKPGAPPEAILLAARAEAGWGGWPRVSDYLRGKPWLDVVAGGDGWFWLARALEEEDDEAGALAAYERYLKASRGQAGDRQLVAEMRRALILLRQGQGERGAAALEAMRGRVAGVEPWIDALAAEALAERGDTAQVARLVAATEEPAVWLRGRRALITAHERAGDRSAARALAVQARGQAGDASARAELSLRAARLALALGDTAAARADLREAMQRAPRSAGGRGAASLLAELGALSPADRLARAGILDRAGDNRGAAREYRAWLALGAGTEAERRAARLSMGAALLDAGDAAGAIETLRPLQDTPGRTGARAMLLTGRAELRRRSPARATAVFTRLASRHPGSEDGAEGLFLVADLRHDAGDAGAAAALYKRVAGGFPGTDRAGLSLMRLGGIAFVGRRFEEAASAWDEYRTRYPSGERWVESTYWAGRAREATGDAEGARALYRDLRKREPISYYSVRAAERLGEQFWPVEMSPAPPESPEARARVEGWMRGVDLLREAGLHEEAEAEADRWIERAGNDAALLYPLGETLNERGYTVRGIRIGMRLQRETAVPSERLLKIVYPFPYRDMMTAEAREKGLDPFMVAALTRQESMFKARISSPVGARGLMQIMPETGRLLARGASIENWDPELLFQPEINAHLGTRYLAEQMERYDESLPSVFSAYNAGPHRIDRWRRFPEYRDEELFTERIPYRETRDYVKILTRNAAIYRGLYGAD